MKLTLVTGGTVLVRKYVARYFNLSIMKFNIILMEYPNESVIYIVNRFFWELGRKSKRLVDGLSVISNNVFEKRKASCFSNKQLLEYLQKINARELELVGVDGNYCVGASAIEGVGNEYKILFNELLIGIGNYGKFKRRKISYRKWGCVYIVNNKFKNSNS